MCVCVCVYIYICVCVRQWTVDVEVLCVLRIYVFQAGLTRVGSTGQSSASVSKLAEGHDDCMMLKQTQV